MNTIKSQIFNKDSRKLSKVLPSGQMIQTTISSPPYYDMKDYGPDGQVGFGQTYSDYLDDITDIFKQVLEHTVDDGTLWIIVDTFKRDNGLVLLPYDIADRLKETGWILQNIIIWKKDKTVPWATGGFVQRKFEYILFFSKNTKYKSYGDRTRVYDKDKLKNWWIKYPERYNPKGRALDEIWEFPIPVQGSWGNEYIRHFCPLPKEMVATMISLSTDEGDLVFDPFSGTGTVPAQAAYMKRKYIGFELNSEYVKQCNQYIEKTLREGQEDYTKSLDMSGQSNFETEIVNLRALKFGRVLLRKIEEYINYKQRFKMYVGRPVSKDGMIMVKFVIIGVTDEDYVGTFVEEVIHKAPLSKFGIDADILFSKNFPSIACNEYFYSRTNSYSFLRNVKREDNSVAVISPICVDLKVSDY